MLINQQKPMKLDRREDGTLHVHSWFHTIQGEGPFAGSAAFFIRLAGCNLQCPACDTEYTEGAVVMTVDHVVYKVRQDVSLQELIVITGGEPFRQNITPLVRQLLWDGFNVQIETNGVLYPGDDFPWKDDNLTVVCSPKTGKIHPKTAELVDAYKYVLDGNDVAEDGLPIHALDHPLFGAPHVARPPADWPGSIYLQPLDTKNEELNALHAKAVAASVMRHKEYIMGVQMHKMTGLP